MPIGRHLLRLLGLFVEYGPGFRPVEGETQSSPPELALDEMVFIVTEEFEVGERKNTSPNPLLNKRILEEGLRSYLAVIACSGLLWRKVKRLRVIQRGGGDVGKEEDTEISVDDVEQVEQGKVDATAKQWGDYGWIPGRSTNLV